MQHILFTDVDRTLLTHSYEVLPQVKHAFNLASEAGLKIVFVTARAPDSLMPVARALNNSGICCCFGGGWVGELATFREHFSHRIPSGLACSILKRATEKGALPVWYDVRDVYAPIINDVVERQLGNVGEIAQKIDEKLLESSPMKIMLIDKREVSSLGEIANNIAQDVTVSFSHRHLLEIGPKGVDKGTGLSSVVSTFDGDSITCHAVGDAENDIPLLRASQHRYTVANGLSELKAMSEFVGRSCDEAGLADVIGHIIKQHMS